MTRAAATRGAAAAARRAAGAATPTAGATEAQASPSALLTVADVARRWRVREQHVYGLVREGGVPCVRIGRYLRFRLQSIERWEREQEADDA